MRAKLVNEGIFDKFKRTKSSNTTADDYVDDQIKQIKKYSTKLDIPRSKDTGIKHYIDQPEETRYNYGAYREWKDGRDEVMGSDEPREYIDPNKPKPRQIENWNDEEVAKLYLSSPNGDYKPGDKEHGWGQEELDKWDGLEDYLVNDKGIKDPAEWIAQRL